MLTKEKLEEIRICIAEDPEDSPARILLAEIDRSRAAQRERTNSDIRHMLGAKGFTLEEIERLISAVDKGWKIETEYTTCRVCKGRGRQDVMGCIGSRNEDCQQCFGNGKSYQMKIPPEDYTLPV